MPKKHLILFMPSIEGGGVEKNLFIISNYLGKKIPNSILITGNKSFNSKFENLKVINPKINVENLLGKKASLYKTILFHLIEKYLNFLYYRSFRP